MRNPAKVCEILGELVLVQRQSLVYISFNRRYPNFLNQLIGNGIRNVFEVNLFEVILCKLRVVCQYQSQILCTNW